MMGNSMGKLGKIAKDLGCMFCGHKPPYCPTCDALRYIDENREQMRKSAAAKYAPKPKPKP